jgi:hypothetical protein
MGEAKGKRPELIRARVSADGHNNIELNPVFRGMVRSKDRRTSNQRKTL